MASSRLFFLSFFLCIFSLSALASPIININQDTTKLKNYSIEYFIDTSQTMKFEQLRNQTFHPTNSTTTLGNQASVTWYRIKLHNQEKQQQKLYLHLPKAYHLRSVAIFEESSSLINQASIDLNTANNHPLMYQGTVVYPFTLPAQTTTSLYIKSHAYSHQWFAAEIYDDEQSKKALVGGHLDIALLVGMLAALVFYNSLLYLATSKKENILYSLYLISGQVWIALAYGLISKTFNVYGDWVFMLNLTVFTMPIFLVLFMMAIFETSQTYPKEHKGLQAILVLLVLGFAYGLFDISSALKYASSLALIMMLVTFSVSISLFRKGNPLVKYFLIGHTFFVIFNAYAVLYYKGLIEPNYVNSHGVGIGIVLEALTLAFIISHRIKILESIRAKQAELTKQASTDPLTQLYNRRYFLVEASHLVEKAQQNTSHLSVMMLDIDHFKAINDQHGHKTGDLVLIQVANLFNTLSREQDLIARFGGEEFVILLPSADSNAAKECAERIRQGIEAHSIVIDEKTNLKITISIGVAEMNIANQESIESTINRADEALYLAKAQGRNQVNLAELQKDL
ncbi:sensor domain-containing diguanylate cyclase [Marinospirillum insulare]|nr:diguanylate cyclase [Marinospirillum insulare]